MMNITCKSRILAAVLAVAMVLALVPVMAAAANEDYYMGYANVTYGDYENGQATNTIETIYFDAEGKPASGTIGVRISNTANDLFYYDMFAVREDGKVEFSITMNDSDPTGKYTVEFIGADLGDRNKACFYWNGASAEDDFVTAAKAKINAGNFNSVEAQQFIVSSNATLYKKFVLNTNADNGVSKLYSDRAFALVENAMKNTQYSSDYFETLEEQTVVALFGAIQNDTTKAYMDNLISDDDVMDYVDDGSRAYTAAKNRFDTFSAAGKSQVALTMCASLGEFETTDDVATAFIDAVGEDDDPGKGGNSTTISGGGTSYKPSTGVTVSVANVFTDIDTTAYWWLIQPLQALYDGGYINGRTATTFAPGENITRAEFLKILLAELDMVNGSYTANFSDVNAGDWFYNYVAAGVAQGIVKGRSETEFAPNDLITREEICVMTMRAVRAKNISLGNSAAGASFTDQASISDWAADDVTSLKAAGIISGRDTGAFDPQAYATRAEAVKILYGIYVKK